MTLYIQTDTNFSQTPGGPAGVDAQQASFDLALIVNDTSLKVDDPTGPYANMQEVHYTPSSGTKINGPRTMIQDVATNSYSPSYAQGQNVDTIILPAQDDFILGDGTLITQVGVAVVPPFNSGLEGAWMNPTTNCIIVYDTTRNKGKGLCAKEAGKSGKKLTLCMTTDAFLYHGFSCATRVLGNTQKPMSTQCKPASDEESAAITDENDLRTTQSNSTLRDTGNACLEKCKKKKYCHECCIIATVTSRSHRSAEVQALRNIRDDFLRRTAVGFDFFDSLHYDYYAFSPQVCTIMARDPRIPPLIFEGYVRPLLAMLRAFQAHAFGLCDDAGLARLFLDEIGDRAEQEKSLAAVRRTARFWAEGEIDDDEVGRRLADLLRDKALPSEHVRWGLVEPIGIYLAVLERALEAPEPAAVGAEIRKALDAWAPGLPIEHVWASLPAAELAAEMDWIDRFLLKTDAGRAAFRRRLKRKFGDIPPIRNFLAAAA